MGVINRKPSAGGSTPASVGLGNVTNDTQIKLSDKGTANGVASLGSDGKVPSAQLPPAGGGGSGLPAGGNVGQTLFKLSGSAGDAVWGDLPAVSLRFVEGAITNLCAPTFAPTVGPQGTAPGAIRMRMLASGTASSVSLYITADNNSPSRIRVSIFDAAGGGAFGSGTLLAQSAVIEVGQSVGGAEREFVLAGLLAYSANQILDFVVTPLQGALSFGSSERNVANPDSFTGMQVVTWWNPGGAESQWNYQPWIKLFRQANTRKGTLNALDPADMPVVTDVAALAHNAAAILDNGTDPPRFIRKRANGSVWYGAPFGNTP